MIGTLRSVRLIAVDPTHNGFGFAIFEYPSLLMDWGVAHVGREKNKDSLKRFEYLVDWFQPQAVVVEDCMDPGCRRRARTRALIAEIMDFSAFFDLTIFTVPWRRVRELVGGDLRATKEDVATAVARRFPEIADRLPPHRKLWMPEDVRMNIFDAVALALAALATNDRAA
jgi:hypothetical protein